jgi:hypothetical protein
MNQLIQGILRWGAEHVRQGRPTLNEKIIGEEPATECVWFGKPTRPYTVGTSGHAGMFVFMLDYSDRKALETDLVEIDQIDETEFVELESIRDGDPSWDLPERQQAMKERHEKLVDAGMDPNDISAFHEAERALFEKGEDGKP